MVPKIHKKQRSFRLTAHYVLHDRDQPTSHRVAWTETRNLATRNPDAAWRVMAATSMDQDRLKQQAGIPNTGRKSKDHVLHFTLSWHPDEARQLNRTEMLRATKTMLQVMGAQDHQCLIVAHNDQPQPHVHVIVNRVNHRDGRMLSSGFERLKASRWAQRYEEERGKIYCAERVVNNAARERGEYTRGEQDLPRHVHEAVVTANDNERRKQLIDRHKREAHRIKQAERGLATRQREAWQQLQTDYKNREQRIELAAKTLFLRHLQQLRRDYRPRWQALFHEHEAHWRQFEQREAKLLGRVQNALRAIDFRSLVGGPSSAEEGRATTFREAFQVLADSGARRQGVELGQRAAKQQLLREQRQAEARLREKIATARDRSLAQHRLRFATQRNDLLLREDMERARLRTLWHTKRLKLREEINQLRGNDPVRSVAKEMPPSSPTPPTASVDLLPRRGAQQAARRIDSWREIQRDRMQADRDHDRDDDHGR